MSREEFLGDPGGSDLAVGVTSGDAGPYPCFLGGGELFESGEQQAADPLQRVTLAATVAGRGLGCAAADVVDGSIREPDHMKVI
jgi:hypothetical protein